MIEDLKYLIPGSIVMDGNTSITELEGSTDIEGILSLQYCTSLHQLPETLSVAWDLDFSYSGIESFPKEFFVGENIIGSHSQLRSMATLKHIQKDLILTGCEELEEMPEELIVNGNLDLSYCTRVKQLPKKLIVRGCLDLEGSSITNLPEKLLVGGDICLSGTPITCLPDGLQVGGYLDLSGCRQLTALPSKLSVRTFMNLFESGVESFSDTEDVKVGGIVVNHSGSLITSKNGLKMAIPNPDDDLTPQHLLDESRVPLDAVFMGNDNFISFNNELWRIIFARNGVYVVEDFGISVNGDGPYVFYRGEEGRFQQEYLSSGISDDIQDEWFL